MQLIQFLPHRLPAGFERRIGNSALLVDPDPLQLITRKSLLSGSCSSVQTACMSKQVFEMQPEEEPNIAILSDALGSFHLQAVAEYIRHRWPHTRILVIGEAAPALEDQLYDETVPSDSSQEEFLRVIRKCSRT